MSLLSVLKDVGKGLEDVAGWVKIGVQVAEPIVGLVDPPLAPILSAVEVVLNVIPQGKTNAALLQQLVQAMATSKTMEHSAGCCGCSTCNKG